VSTQLTSDQVLALAPDASSASAGKKLGSTKTWKNLGQNSAALWGECQGSALYQVKIDLSTLTTQCNCPSRKFPCKHGLGLLFLAATDAGAIPTAEPPGWVAAWLAKRQAGSARTGNQKQGTEALESSERTQSAQASQAAQAKRVEKRQALVLKGLDSLDLWLNDLVRHGLASAQTQPISFWESRAAQMIDAQAPGIAARVRHLATIPNASRTWPGKLLDELGRLALLIHAYRRSEQLDTLLQEDVRQMIGWTLSQEEVGARGEIVSDDWLILGQTLDEEERVRVQRTWLLGIRSQRQALLLQFSAAGAPFPEMYLLGSHEEADLLFWPSACPQRARFAARRGASIPITEQLPCVETINAFLTNVSGMLARQPWMERFLCVLHNVTPICIDNGAAWYARDAGGAVLPLTKGEHWQLLALSGGHPVDLAGEWDGETLFPLGVLVDNTYIVLGRTLQ
jgi:uncharacterized Zn finger protein